MSSPTEKNWNVIYCSTRKTFKDNCWCIGCIWGQILCSFITLLHWYMILFSFTCETLCFSQYNYFHFLCFSFYLLSTRVWQFMDNSTFFIMSVHLECQLLVMNNNHLFPSPVSHIFLCSKWLKRIILGLAPVQSLHFLSY